MQPRLAAFSLAAGTFVADRVTKWIVEARVSRWETIPVIEGFFDIIHTRNPGAAFSLLADADRTLRLVVLVGMSMAILVFVAYLLWQSTRSSTEEHWTVRTGLSLVLGGAAGNVYDRIARGEVTDFLDVYIGQLHWPAFNVADAAITVGAGLILLSLWRQRRQFVRT